MKKITKNNRLWTTMTFTFAIAITVCMLIPVRAFAENVSISQADFDEALESPGVTTSTGITYNEDYSCYTFKPGYYILAEDIDVGDSEIWIIRKDEYVFDLNGKTLSRSGTLSDFFYFAKGKLTITGNGTMNNDPGPGLLTLVDCEAVIENGNFTGFISCSTNNTGSTLTINDGSFHGSIWLTGENTSGVINNGNVYSGYNTAVEVSDGASITVNNGIFTSGHVALKASSVTESSPDGKPAKSLVINAGTFQNTSAAQEPDFAHIGGLFIESCDEVTLNGGTFIGEGDALGGIVACVDPENPYEDFEEFPGEGYTYSEKLKLTEGTTDEGTVFASQSSISVIKHVHGLTKVAAVDPTCTEAGSIEYYVCSAGAYPCGLLFSDAEGKNEITKEDTVIPAIGHDWGEWEVTKEATETEEGVETRVCSVCGETETRVIPVKESESTVRSVKDDGTGIIAAADTGDNNFMPVWIALATAATVATVTVVFIRKKRSEK